MAKVVLAHNLIPIRFVQSETPLDLIAEYDTLNTIQAISSALQVGGHEVIPLEADEMFHDRLRAVQPQIVFNIAEGLRGESREAHVPASCEMLGVPYTGSSVLSLALCQDKAQTNQALSYHGLQVPAYQVYHSQNGRSAPGLDFPLIVKLVHEGSSMGLSEKSVVDDPQALGSQVDYLIQTYREPVLVQRFIEGREFTVGVLGNRCPAALPIVENIFEHPRGIVLFDLDDDVLPLVAQARGADYVETYQDLSAHYKSVCPADVSPQLAERINATVLRAFRAMQCRDWCRVDLRVDRDEQIYILELNPIAGIAPGYWLPRSAQVAGLEYTAFINRILDIALDRIQGGGRY